MSPVIRAVTVLGVFMRMISTSSPSSRKKPFFSATPAGRNDMLGLVTETRTFSAAPGCRTGASRTRTRNTRQQVCFLMFLRRPAGPQHFVHSAFDPAPGQLFLEPLPDARVFVLLLDLVAALLA